MNLSELALNPPPGRTKARSLLLASQSPARAKLLAEAGVLFEVAPSDFVDDPTPPQGREPLMLAVELASRKARHAKLPRQASDVLVLGADTISVGPQGELLGKPSDADDARRMIERFMDHTHPIISGVALWSPESDHEEVFADVAQVWIGRLTPKQLEDYLASGQWQGKAGGYNLAHVTQQGWPIEVTGDRTTVQGLPMKRLLPRLAAWGVRA